MIARFARHLINVSLLLFSLSPYFSAYAQDTDSTIVEEDFSMYGDVELAGGAKRFCTSKVFDLSPNKLISIGYDFQGSHTMSLASVGNAPTSDFSINSVQGIRVSANVPVISKTNLLINLGVNYWEANYSVNNPESHPLASTLQATGLRTTGFMATIFKPLNEKNFLLFQASSDLSGDYFFADLQPLSQLRYSATAVYGWKKHDRLMYGFGASRTYRVGEPNYIPVFLYNYTFPSRKWGIESVFPARAQVRRTFNTRTLGFFGYELEGQSYFISALQNESDFTNPQLRRSELRIRFTFERSIKDFLWVSAQAGLRYNWSYNVDDGDFFRGFTGTQEYAMENTLSNAFYFNISLNLVSP
jgi:Domain of unknown function (DUF6268)